MDEVTVESIMTTLLEINESLKSIALSLELVTHQKREAKLYFDAMKPRSGRISFAKRQRDMVCRCLVE